MQFVSAYITTWYKAKTKENRQRIAAAGLINADTPNAPMTSLEPAAAGNLSAAAELRPDEEYARLYGAAVGWMCGCASSGGVGGLTFPGVCVCV